jgi:predicted RNase H-like HicB family nuclease
MTVRAFRLLVFCMPIANREGCGDPSMTLTAVYMSVPEGYIGFVEEIPGANSQGETLEEVRENLREAVQLVLEANRELAEQALTGKDVAREPFELAS